MDLRKEYAVDTKMELDGVEHEIGEGAKIVVARMGNPAWQRAYEKIPVNLRNAASGNRLKGAMLDAFDKANAKVLAQTVLLGWSGITEDGAEVPYSVEKAEQYLLAPEMRDFKALVVQLATDASYFRKEEVAEKGKSSRSSS